MIRRLWLPLILASGCAYRAGVSSDLPLKRVVVFRNGVGYFEREGHVGGDEVKFQVRPSHIGDFLATLAVMEKGGSSVKSAAFPLQVSHAPDGQPVVAKPLETVTLHLDGRGHDIAVGYIAEQPIWRPTYRLVLNDKKLWLQSWGVVQNLSGEDWREVSLSLVAGSPIAFSSTLGDPITPPRPVVTDSGEFIDAVPVAESSLAQAPAAVAPASPPAEAFADAAEERFGADKDDAPHKGERKKLMRSRGAAPAISAGMMGRASATQAMPVMTALPNRNTSLLARAAVASGSTTYDLPQAVTVPNGSATLVLLLDRPVPGEAVHLFAPDPGVPDSSRHPFRVVRFKNDTEGLLEKGPLAVLEQGNFLGQGVLEALSAGGEATVPYALDRGLAVDTEHSGLQEGARLARIEGGGLTIERDSVQRTLYRARNGTADSVALKIRHPRQPETKLKDPPPGSEDLVGKGAAFIPMLLAARATAELPVEERRSFEMAADWMSPLADEAIQAYFKDPKADRPVVVALGEAWQVRSKLERELKEREKLMAEKNVLVEGTREARESLAALRRSTSAGVSKLREQLSARLLDMDKRLAAVQERQVALDLSIQSHRIEFQERVRAIKVARPLPTA
ncbi:MAG: hypothetical protein ACKVPX_00755 [Myxococcaceae bacterium]